MMTYKFSKLGTYLYNTCMKFTMFLVKHHALYYLLACTWGFILTFIGAIITCALCVIGNHPESFYWIYCHKIKELWGGFEMGLMFVRDTTSTDKVSEHEFGHTFQNCLFGPFMIFIVSGPSCIRYWYRKYQEKNGIKLQRDYDDIWFEAAATDCGAFAVKYIKNNKMR